ncbi:MAG: hypothetical protein O2955_07500 [Planctomycetota bacterium]|jgi:hypothetical protein|nr:hypothetical protein [Planctomycetota bacterium]MDA1212344.1 hypothetical protein [Planctomycetota bacterium]
MANDAREMLMYLRLALISRHKSQLLPCDKFLVLTGVSALKAGYPDIAENCHQYVTRHQPSHLLSEYSNLSEAMIDDDFQPYLRVLQKFCSFEQAEHLLQNSDDAPSNVSFDAERDEYECADIARDLLADPVWNSPDG